MRSYVRVGLAVGTLALGLALAGCESFDPTDVFDSEIFNTKKKLPGERQPVFPQGTPGVPQGVPPELVKGYQAPAEPPPKEAAAPPKEATAAPKEATAEPTEPKAKPKPKPKPKVVAKPVDTSPPTTGTVPPTQPSAQASQWPDPPQAQRPPASSGWSGSAQPSGGVAWPDPPAPR